MLSSLSPAAAPSSLDTGSQKASLGRRGPGWPGGQAGGAALQPRHLPRKRQRTPSSIGFCFSFL
uniref:Uncharacterized protein n=1 Tax=Neovison vison TaxID=452646 RepID=A0A8C7BNU1_NEOVI